MYEIYTPVPDERMIFIFDRDLHLLGVLENFASLTMERSLFGVGSFSLTADIGTSGAELLRAGNLICLGKSDSRAGVIGYRVIKEDRTGTITVSGHMLKGVAASRIIVPPTETELPGSYGWEWIKSTEAENVLRHYFGMSCVYPRNANRTIPGVVMDDLHDPPRGPVTPWYAEHKEKLVDVMSAIGDWTEYGWDIRLDMEKRRLVFVVVPVRDRTKEGGNPVIFSREIENLGPYTYTENTRDYTNSIYIGGAGEYEEQFVLTRYVDESGQEVEIPYAGWDRTEAWISAGNISDPEVLITEGLRRYNQHRKPLETVTAEVYNIAPFYYGIDWDIGDKVTLLITADGQERQLDTQITNVTEVYENGFLRIVPTFGTEELTLKQRLEMLESR